MALSMKTVRYAAWVGLNVIIAKQVDAIVREPYMDEPFHVPQAQAFCRGEWTTWDPKITTPPGLYLLSIAMMKLFLLPCTLPILRLTNALLLTLTPPLLDGILSQLRLEALTRSFFEPSAEALIISSFPIFWFFGFLYYTDVASVVMVLVTLWVSRRGWHWVAAVSGLVSCLFRQTNIIWFMYVFGNSALHALHYPPERAAVEANLRKPMAERNREATCFVFDHDTIGEKAEFLDYLIATLTVASERETVYPLIPPYLVSCILFMGFVIWNGGIVLGDKSNHVPALHIPQVYYFIATATFFGWPILVSSKRGVRVLARRVRKRMFGGLWQMYRTAFLTAVICWTIHRYTIHHPFLLSDNRHYTFYVWRRVFMSHPLVPYALAPCYLACCWAWFLRIGESNSLLNTMLLPHLVVAALLPTPLLEPRYFIVPYILGRILVSKERVPRWALILEGAWYALINWATIYVFLYKSREGVDGVIRFMW